MTSGSDPSRQAHKLRKLILYLQESFLVIEKCPQPVIAAVHSGCVGGGVDMVCNCDIRLCSADAWFQVKVHLASVGEQFFAIIYINFTPPLFLRSLPPSYLFIPPSVHTFYVRAAFLHHFFFVTDRITINYYNL